MVVLHEVDEAAGGGHEQVATCLELTDLTVELGAAHDHDGRLAGLGADLARDGLDLRGELAGGGHDERKRVARLGNLLAGRDALQRGQREGASLARAGLRAGKHVAPLENGGDGGCLDGGWRGEAEGIDPGENLLV